MGSRKIQAGLALAATALVLLVWLARPERESPASRTLSEPGTEAAARPDLLVPGPEPGRREADAAPESRSDSANQATHATEEHRLRGVVEDLQGLRQPFAEVAFWPAPPRDSAAGHGQKAPPTTPTVATSDAQGGFEILVQEATGHLEARSDHLVTILAPLVRPPWADDLVYRVVVAQAAPITGLVTGEGSGPLEQAFVQVRLPDSVLLKSAVADRSRALEAAAFTDADGRFEFRAFPVVDGTQILALARGYSPASYDRPIHGWEEIQLELKPLPRADVVCGLVVDSMGLPANAAQVSIGGRIVISGADGMFCLDLDDAWTRFLSRAEPIQIVAIRGDSRSERMILPALDAGLVDAWPTPLVLRLDAPRLTLKGRVLDKQGRPVRHTTVSVADPTPFGFEETTPGSDMLLRQSVELAGGAVGIARSKSDGAFLLSGLEAREYVLEALDESSLACVRTPPIMAGTEGVVIEFAPELGMITGRVVDHTGDPLPDVRLALTKESAMRGLLIGNMTYSGADGTFGLGPVSDGTAMLRIESDVIMPLLRYELAQERFHDATIVLARRCNVRVNWPTADKRTARVMILDRNGSSIEPIVWRIDEVSVAPGIPWLSEDSYCVPEDAAYAVAVAEDGSELQRVPLACIPGETLAIKF